MSVHGANRLGSNSLIDLVVFGRAAAHSSAARGRCTPGTKPGRRCRPVRGRQCALARLDKHAQRPRAACRTAAASACEMQKVMQSNMPRCTAPARQPEAGSVSKLIHERYGAPTTRTSASPIVRWCGTRDLVEAMEFDNLIVQAVVDDGRRQQPARESRGAHAREDLRRSVTTKDLDEAHAGDWSTRSRRQRGPSTTARCGFLHDVQRDAAYIEPKKFGCTEALACRCRFGRSRLVTGIRATLRVRDRLRFRYERVAGRGIHGPSWDNAYNGQCLHGRLRTYLTSRGFEWTARQRHTFGDETDRRGTLRAGQFRKWRRSPTLWFTSSDPGHPHVADRGE